MPEIGAPIRFTFKIHGVDAPTWVARFEATEALSTLFAVELVLTSEDRDIAFADVVARPALLTIEADGSEPRHLHGMVSRFRRAEESGRLAVYHATVVPRLGRLRRRHDSRIFQAKNVPKIIEQVLAEAGVSDYRLALNASYSPREFCVQYRESDFAFISRLMEEEGIYYFFEHTEAKHVLVLCDAKGALTPIAAPDTVAYRGGMGSMAHGEGVYRFGSAEEIRSGTVTLSDFNFKKPSLSLLSSAAAKVDTDLEVYDYPGEYDAPGEGSTYSSVRIEEQQARRALADGESNCVRLTPGYLFTLSDHPHDADNRRYLITAVRHRGTQARVGEGAPLPREEATVTLGNTAGPAGMPGDRSPGYTSAFQALAADVPFRPERVTPRPTINGVQTAIVTGPGGEEIHTDEHGRVKVHFHWDRKGKKDDTSSCWIRVSQLWAGAGWGAMWIPRVGHEVIVDFLEGDPDRPIVIGRVYHGTNVPPYPLPAEKTKSTIKSDSSKGGGGFNELRFEDKKGSEEIYLHAQKDWNIVVEHDKTQRVGHDETHQVGHDRVKQVNHDEQERIGNDKSISVGSSHTETIGMIESITVGAASIHTVGGALTETVAMAKAMTVGGTLTEIIGGKMSVTVGGNREETVVGSLKESVKKGADRSVGEDYTLSVTKAMKTTVGEDQNLSVAKTQTVAVGEKYELTVGDGKVTVLKSGEITIEGKNITIKGTGTIEVKGSKLQVESDGTVDVKAGGTIKLKGSGIEMN